MQSMQASELVYKLRLWQVVRHREIPFRGVIFDVDPEYSNTDEWYQDIPE
jgi:heat shock protein HspQ